MDEYESAKPSVTHDRICTKCDYGKYSLKKNGNRCFHIIDYMCETRSNKSSWNKANFCDSAMNSTSIYHLNQHKPSWQPNAEIKTSDSRIIILSWLSYIAISLSICTFLFAICVSSVATEKICRGPKSRKNVLKPKSKVATKPWSLVLDDYISRPRVTEDRSRKADSGDKEVTKVWPQA